ncbi:uncharacterized protein C11orf24 homolog [Choloepus didactylus]|uniref:uncharacterized protein C11orf24 homolog n=1 Tax=Choloepus didactylus TaxID=27675 RepID=UPI00189DDB50|nr:uncharacterized protein C11orf24 homolog [Choloepus didactylus]XP_037696995.1 uncharacterized protein C11orf24 homolog [Choloepus didactylus]XP_037696996.1 uncharacterized protein C11orf24 homolog [Choloepus didactylus]
MWPVLVLLCISSSSLSESQVIPPDPGHSVPNLTWDNSVQKNASVETAGMVGNRMSENITTVTLSAVTLTKETLLANSSIEVTAETTHRTEAGAADTTGGTADHTASTASTLAASSVPTSLSWTVTPAATGRSSPSTPHVQVPSNSTLPKTAMVVTSAPSDATAAVATPGTDSPGVTHDSSQHTASSSQAGPALTTSPRTLNVTSAQASTTQVSTSHPVVSTASRSTPTLSSTTPEPTTLPSVASMSTTSSTQAGEPTASTVPAPHVSPTPAQAATSPMTHSWPNPSLPTRATEGPGVPQTPEQLGTKAIPGAAPSGLTPGSSGEPKIPATDSCPPSTQGHYLVVTTGPLPQFWVNRTILLGVLLLGVTLFITVLFLFALQAYESYKKKDYTQVDYLINGMYADSEM